MIDECGNCGEHSQHSASSERCTQVQTIQPPDELTDWFQAIDPDPTRHHFVSLKQQPAPGHGNQVVNLIAVCSCGWRSGEHQIYLGASTSWAQERARHQLKNAGIAHIRSLTPSAT
jgi:hypothetical protein